MQDDKNKFKSDLHHSIESTYVISFPHYEIGVNCSYEDNLNLKWSKFVDFPAQFLIILQCEYTMKIYYDIRIKCNIHEDKKQKSNHSIFMVTSSQYFFTFFGNIHNVIGKIFSDDTQNLEKPNELKKCFAILRADMRERKELLCMGFLS